MKLAKIALVILVGAAMSYGMIGFVKLDPDVTHWTMSEGSDLLFLTAGISMLIVLTFHEHFFSKTNKT